MKITPRLAASSLAALLFLAACADAPHVRSDADPAANFAAYRSFALMPRNRAVVIPQPGAIDNPLVFSRIQDEIRRELEGKGYTLADPMAADFVVDFTIGAQERIDVHAYPSAWGGPPMLAGGNWGRDIDLRQYREGTLAIDVFDVRTRRPVWHGWAQKELSRKDIEQSAAAIHDAVQAVLAKFPPTA